MENKVYIVDLYNKFSNDEIISKFKLNGRWWAIKKVKLDWGHPILTSIEENEDPYLHFHLYNTLEEAKSFIHKLKQLEGTRF